MCRIPSDFENLFAVFLAEMLRLFLRITPGASASVIPNSLRRRSFGLRNLESRQTPTRHQYGDQSDLPSAQDALVYESIAPFSEQEVANYV